MFNRGRSKPGSPVRRLSAEDRAIRDARCFTIRRHGNSPGDNYAVFLVQEGGKAQRLTSAMTFSLACDRQERYYQRQHYLKTLRRNEGKRQSA